MKKIYITIGISLAVVAAAFGGYKIMKSNGFGLTETFASSQNIPDKDKQDIEEATQSISKAYEKSKKAHILSVGQTFPWKNFPIFQGPKTNANIDEGISFITFGNEFSTKIKKIQNKLKDTKIKLIHFMYPSDLDNLKPRVNYTLDTSKLSEFDKSVFLIDFISTYQKYKAYLDSLGIANSGYGFLVKNKKVVYYTNSLGLFEENDVDDLIKTINGNKYLPSSVVQSGDNIPTKILYTEFSNNDAKAIESFLKKGRLGIIASDDRCSSCDSKSQGLENFLSKWKKENKRVIVLTNGNSNIAKISNSIIELTLKSKIGIGSNLTSTWNFRGFPEAIVVNGGKLEGRVDFVGLTTGDQVSYGHMYLSVLDRLLKEK